MIIGITGHQTIADPSRWGWVRAQFDTILRRHGQGGRVLAALAIGADQLFVTVALEQCLPVDVVLPCQDYEATFSQENRQRYSELLTRAATIQTLPFDHPSEEAFLAAGQFVVNRCDLLVALWNGKPAAGKGGTGDIIAYAQSLCRPIIHIQPVKILQNAKDDHDGK